MTVRLKVIMERGVCRAGCCGCLSYSAEDKASFPKLQENIESVGEILRVLRDRYGDKVEVSLVDPRNMLAFWDNIRYRIRPAAPAWILGGKKIFEGIPGLAELQRALDLALENAA